MVLYDAVRFCFGFDPGEMLVLPEQALKHLLQGLCLELTSWCHSQQTSADVNLVAPKTSLGNGFFCSSGRIILKVPTYSLTALQLRDATAQVRASSYVIQSRAAAVTCGQEVDRISKPGIGHSIKWDMLQHSDTLKATGVTCFGIRTKLRQS